MEEGNQSNRKRPFTEDDESTKPPPQKRVRFPKGKKVKSGDYAFDEEAKPVCAAEPRLAAKERVMRRNQITAELLDEENSDVLDDISRAELLDYKDNETFVDDDIQLEPFNLAKEREEGYFDADGNYVEYVRENEVKDAWLDSVEVKQQFSGKRPISSSELHEDNESPDLSSEEIAKIKRRIADVLEPGETVLRALKRLRGTSNNRKEKMSVGTKQVFDQLTDDAVKLLNDGDLDVYNEKQENFHREAGLCTALKFHVRLLMLIEFILYCASPEGYEKLAQARGQIISVNEGAEKNEVENEDDAFDMFAEVDAPTTNQPSDVDNRNVENNSIAGGGDSETDYIYDETSGYYYSSSSGYYYDASSGLYCSATSGQWYSYNEELGTYEEVPQAAPAVN
ncbi:RNA splicing factor [Lithospermum erythrorhizon]|uniref:RNA splicing factor n=1 Tax=Lithospermum erythrorhizon TaxID=34254 RepID=A0AAV3PU17_LITER